MHSHQETTYLKTNNNNKVRVFPETSIECNKNVLSTRDISEIMLFFRFCVFLLYAHNKNNNIGKVSNKHTF